MADDPYEGQGQGLTTYGKTWEVITPSDSVDLSRVYKAIINASADDGVIVCDDHGATTSTAFFVGKGQDLYGIRPKRIRATDTTVALIVGVIE